MISVPETFNNNPFADKKFRQLIDYFNRLEKALEYPNCENQLDIKRVLSKAQDEAIMSGYI